MAVLHSFERALALLAKGVIDCDALITNRYRLDEYSAAIDTFLSGSGLKQQREHHGDDLSGRESRISCWHGGSAVG